MTQSSALAQRLRAVFLDGTWIANTNYKAQITQINYQQAYQKIGELNTIATLTFHVNYYLAGLIHAFETGVLEISDKYSFNLPPSHSEAEWKNLVNEFLNNASTFANIVEKMNDSDLDQPFVDEKYGSNLNNIEAVIEHGYYHLGQISLLNKMMKSSINFKKN